MNVTDLLLKNAERFGDRIAIADAHGSVTFSDFAREVVETAARLDRSGIRKGDRVLVFVPMSRDLYRVMSALLYIGAIAVFIDAWAGTKRIVQSANLADARAMIGIPKAHLLRLFSPVIRRIPIKLFVPKPLRHIKLTRAEVPTDHPALITFTTGSTGEPKAALRNHEFLLRQHQVLAKTLPVDDRDVALTVLPIFAIHQLALGNTTIIPTLDRRGFAHTDFQAIAEMAVKYGVTSCTASPAFFRELEPYASKITLNRIHVGGAAIFPGTLDRIAASFPSANILAVYGSTEAEPIAVVDADRLRQDRNTHGLLAGTPVHEVELRMIEILERPIDGTEFESLTLPDGTIGEICVRGPHVLTTYFRGNAAFRRNKIVTPQGIWHRTGDAGYFDRTGDLRLVGRAAERIYDGTSWHYVAPAEQQLLSIPSVKVGTIMQTGHAIIAAIQPVGPWHEEDTRAVQSLLPFCEEVRLVKTIPLDPRHGAKIDYALLRTMLLKSP